MFVAWRQTRKLIHYRINVDFVKPMRAMNPHDDNVDQDNLAHGGWACQIYLESSVRAPEEEEAKGLVAQAVLSNRGKGEGDRRRYSST